MAKDKDKPAVTTAEVILGNQAVTVDVGVDPVETIRDLRQQLEAARADTITSAQRLSAEKAELTRSAAEETGRLSKKIEELTARLKAAKSAPTGDYVQMGGKTYPIVGTVQAKFALEEVRRGHIDENIDLIVPGTPS